MPYINASQSYPFCMNSLFLHVRHFSLFLNPFFFWCFVTGSVLRTLDDESQISTTYPVAFLPLFIRWGSFRLAVRPSSCAKSFYAHETCFWDFTTKPQTHVSWVSWNAGRFYYVSLQYRYRKLIDICFNTTRALTIPMKYFKPPKILWRMLQDLKRIWKKCFLWLFQNQYFDNQ